MEIKDGVGGLDTMTDCLIAYMPNVQFGDGTGCPHYEMSGAVGGGSHNALIASYPRIGQWLVVFAQDVALDVAARLLHFRMLADVGIAKRVGYGFYFDETSLWRWISECGFKSCPRTLIFIRLYTVYYLVQFV